MRANAEPRITFLVLSVMLLNITDCIMTTYFKMHFESVELNEFHAILQKKGHGTFIAVKMFLVTFLLMVLVGRLAQSKRTHRVAIPGLWVAFLVYFLNAIYQFAIALIIG